jgi:uncharacterized protein (UPF0332 family)
MSDTYLLFYGVKALLLSKAFFNGDSISLIIFQ